MNTPHIYSKKTIDTGLNQFSLNDLFDTKMTHAESEPSYSWSSQTNSHIKEKFSTQQQPQFYGHFTDQPTLAGTSS